MVHCTGISDTVRCLFCINSFIYRQLNLRYRRQKKLDFKVFHLHSSFAVILSYFEGSAGKGKKRDLPNLRSAVKGTWRRQTK